MVHEHSPILTEPRHKKHFDNKVEHPIFCGTSRNNVLGGRQRAQASGAGSGTRSWMAGVVEAQLRLCLVDAVDGRHNCSLDGK